MHKKRSIYDNAGHAVSSTMQKVMTMKANTYICPGGEPSESSRVAEVKKVVFSMTPQAHVIKIIHQFLFPNSVYSSCFEIACQVFFRSNKGSNPDIVIRGNFMQRSFQVRISL